MPMRFTGTYLFVIFVLGGCSSASTSSPSPAPTSPSASTLSTAYVGQCGGCHGKDGSSKQGASALKGSTKAQSAWESAIRNGIGSSMQAFEKSEYSDADMKADFKILTGKTWK